jgi:hypothetical protein
MGSLNKESLERIRRSLAMSPSLTGPVAQQLLDEVLDLRARLGEVGDELDQIADVLRGVGRKARRL